MYKKNNLFFVLVIGLISIANIDGGLLSIVKAGYPTGFSYEAESLQHDVGHIENYPGTPAITTVRADIATDNPGYMIFGPYTNDQLVNKGYKAIFKLRSSGSTTDPVARLEVNSTASGLLADYDLYLNSFATPGNYEEFALSFIRPNDGGLMEYRVWFYDNADVDVDKIRVNEITQTDDLATYQSEKLRRTIGSVISDSEAVDEKAVLSTPSDGQGYMQYGPYTLQQELNNTYRATFRLKVSDNTSSDVIARIDASNSHGTGEWSYLDIRGTDFSSTNTYEFFSVNFSRIYEGTMEYRIYSYGATNLTADYVKVEKITQSTTGYESENLPTGIVTSSIASDSDASGGQARVVDLNDSGYLQYGPYTVDQAANNSFKAVYSMKITNNSSNAIVARIEAYNHNGNGQWVYRNIKANDFARSNNYEDFSLDFTRTDRGSMEYRVYIFGGNAGINLYVDKVDVYKRNDNEWVYESENCYGGTGSVYLDTTASGGKAREATTVGSSSGYLVYGPYTDEQPANQAYTATFRLKTRNNTKVENIARIDVYNPNGTSATVGKNIRGIDFSANNTWQDFSINFSRRSGGTLEYRVYFNDVVDVLSDKVTLTILDNSHIVYQAENMNRTIGSVMDDATANDGKTVVANPGDGVGYMSFGPYTTEQTTGNYEVIFRLKRGSVDSDGFDTPLVRIEAINNDGSGTFVWKNLNARSIKSDYTEIPLYFYRTGEGNMEYRVYFYDQTNIYLDSYEVNQI